MTGVAVRDRHTQSGHTSGKDFPFPRNLLLWFSFVFIWLFAHAGFGPWQSWASETRFALVIGNGAYEGMARLANPVNDAEDVGATLSRLGFSVEVVTDAGLEELENAVLRFRDNLAGSPDSVGFFFYAGHGVQSNGENYLLPVDARINSESLLRTRAVPLQFVLDSLKEARNKLNIIVLDACRDNPFGWARSSSRGLAVVGQQPPGSIVVYSTSAGKVAADGTGRNSVFTEELVQHLRTPGIDISEVLRRTGQAVRAKTQGAQIPAIYSQFFDFFTLAEENFEEPEETDESMAYLLPYFNGAPREIQVIISKAEELARDDQRLSGWRLLAENETDPPDPYLLAAKIRFALLYGQPSQDYRRFTFFDTGGKDYETAQKEGSLVEDTFEFDPAVTLRELRLAATGYPHILTLSLGDYYYHLYAYPIKQENSSRERARDIGIAYYKLAYLSNFLTDVTQVRRYAELLTDAGQGEEAIRVLKNSIQSLSTTEDGIGEAMELWWYLLTVLEQTGKAEEAIQEIDSKLKEVASEEVEPDELFEVYRRGAEIAVKAQRKKDFERFVGWIDQTFPDRWDGGLLRHKYLLGEKDFANAQSLASTLFSKYPVLDVFSDNVLERLLGNYLTDPPSQSYGTRFLEQQLEGYKGDSQRLFALYVYRGAYQYQIAIWGKNASESEWRQAAQSFLSDLELAEALYKTLPSQEEKVSRQIGEIRSKIQRELSP